VTATTKIDFLKGVAEKDVLTADLDNPVAMPSAPKFVFWITSCTGGWNYFPQES
jgi:hypothetical protein